MVVRRMRPINKRGFPMFRPTTTEVSSTAHRTTRLSQWRDSRRDACVCDPCCAVPLPADGLRGLGRAAGISRHEHPRHSGPAVTARHRRPLLVKLRPQAHVGPRGVAGVALEAEFGSVAAPALMRQISGQLEGPAAHVASFVVVECLQDEVSEGHTAVLARLAHSKDPHLRGACAAPWGHRLVGVEACHHRLDETQMLINVPVIEQVLQNVRMRPGVNAVVLSFKSLVEPPAVEGEYTDRARDPEAVFETLQNKAFVSRLLLAHGEEDMPDICYKRETQELHGNDSVSNG